MIVLKRIIIGLGILFVAWIVLFTWIGQSARDFRKEQEPFVRSFVAQLSKHWNISYLADDLSTGTVRQRLRSDPGKQALQQLSQLGELRSARSFELLNYKTGSDGSTGEFTFTAVFENGDATVGITVTELSGSSRVTALTITDVHLGKPTRDDGLTTT